MALPKLIRKKKTWAKDLGDPDWKSRRVFTVEGHPGDVAVTIRVGYVGEATPHTHSTITGDSDHGLDAYTEAVQICNFLTTNEECKVLGF